SADPSWQLRGHVQRANGYRVLGQLSRADQEALNQLQIARQAGIRAQAMTAAIDYASTEAVLRQRPTLALKRIESALARFPMDSLDPLSRPYLALSDLYVASGELTRAEQTLTEYER